MSVLDWILFGSFLAIIVAASLSDGRYVNYLWFKKIQPSIDEANRQHAKKNSK